MLNTWTLTQTIITELVLFSLAAFLCFMSCPCCITADSASVRETVKFIKFKKLIINAYSFILIRIWAGIKIRELHWEYYDTNVNAYTV